MECSQWGLRVNGTGLNDKTTGRHFVLKGVPESAGEARRELRRFLEHLSRLEWSDAAELAMSEIVTNAALHAHTDIDIRLAALSDRLCVEVRDWNCALPEERSYGVDATTGRGMALVRTLALDCGVRRLADGKVVWFQIGDPPERTVDDLLAMWDLHDADADAAAGPTEPNALRVQLLGLPATLWLAARQHHDALLRELHLLNADRDHPFDIAAADTARRYISRAVAEGIDQAEAAGHTRNPLPDGHPSALPWVPAALDVSFELADDPTIFEALQDVLDEGERLATERQLLMRPGLPEIIALRDWASEQAISQAGGAPPIPWSGTDHEHFETATGALEPAHGWDTSAVSTSERGVVAADDTNRIVAVSPSLAERVGWRPEDLVGRRVVTLIPPRLREAHVAGFTRHLATGVAHALGVPLTLPVLCKDGSEINCHFLVEQATATGGRSGYLAWISPVGTDL